MADVVTLTMNPSIDLSVSVERVLPFHKLRSSDERRDAGGGGINVARVLKRFGVDVVAVYPSGGALGLLLRQLVDREGIAEVTIPIGGETREDVTVVERTTGNQYRFVLPGPELSEHEWRACLAKVDALDRRASFVVCSGSLPRGVPDDFYGRVVAAAKQPNRKIIIDSSGPSLRAALQRGVYLVKPNLNELRSLFGGPLEKEADWIKPCRSLIDKHQAVIVVLTLGDQGALLVTGDDVLRAYALPIKPVSVVGAGDSFLGAMIWSLTAGHTIETAFRHGVAAGSAALLLPGTELCLREDVERLVGEVKLQRL
jgi:6-phosphofructokinase 2